MALVGSQKHRRDDDDDNKRFSTLFFHVPVAGRGHNRAVEHGAGHFVAALFEWMRSGAARPDLDLMST